MKEDKIMVWIDKALSELKQEMDLDEGFKLEVEK